VIGYVADRLVDLGATVDLARRRSLSEGNITGAQSGQ